MVKLTLGLLYFNPAEMIGIKPKALALSLYQELIMDFIWQKQRKIWL